MSIMGVRVDRPHLFLAGKHTRRDCERCHDEEQVRYTLEQLIELCDEEQQRYKRLDLLNHTDALATLGKDVQHMLMRKAFQERKSQ